MTTFNSILDVIGNTPLVKIPLPCAASVYAKMEYMNPAGSIKDRSALYMVQQAENQGKLKRGGGNVCSTLPHRDPACPEFS